MQLKCFFLSPTRNHHNAPNDHYSGVLHHRHHHHHHGLHLQVSAEGPAASAGCALVLSQLGLGGNPVLPLPLPPLLHHKRKLCLLSPARKLKLENELAAQLWRIFWEDIQMSNLEKALRRAGSKLTFSLVRKPQAPSAETQAQANHCRASSEFHLM